MLKSRLKELIWDRWSSQEQFAIEAGLHPSTVGALCRNTFSRVDAVTVVKVCRTLGIDVGELFYIEDHDVTDSVNVRGMIVAKHNLCGLVWGRADELRAYFIDGEGGLDYEYTSDTETQERLFALAGYRPSNPWKDGES